MQKTKNKKGEKPERKVRKRESGKRRECESIRLMMVNVFEQLKYE